MKITILRLVYSVSDVFFAAKSIGDGVEALKSIPEFIFRKNRRNSIFTFFRLGVDLLLF